MANKTLVTVTSTCSNEIVKILLAAHTNHRRRRTILTHCFYDSLELNVEEMSAAVTTVIQGFGLQLNSNEKKKNATRETTTKPS